MKQINKLKETGEGIITTITRFPLLVLFLIAAVISNMIAINLQEDERYVRLLITFLLGACIYAVFQMIYERFFNKPLIRITFMGITIALALLYYLLIREKEFNVQITIRTVVILFILLIAFLWVPSIKSRINFNQSFMAAFKAFFMALLFNGVLFLGVALILSVTDVLIFNVDEKAYLHSANIIFILLAPIHLMSLIPYYPNKDDPGEIIGRSENAMDNPVLEEKIKREEMLIKQITPAKFLEALISYIVIPLTAVFTIILLLYIIMNITGDFWTDNLMESLLVSYSIIVIIVYLLASTINNAFSRSFRLVFPKVLVPIVLFQTISSILKIQEAGIGYGRYYVIMFGVFATIAGIWFSLKPIKNNGFIAPVLIILSTISIFPLIDAFSISKMNQLGRLVNALERNDMFDGESVTPKADIPNEDKQIIINSVQALNNMDYAEEIDWLEAYAKSYDFEKTFGFSEYDYTDSGEIKNRYVMIMRKQNSPIPIGGYDFMSHVNIYNNSRDTIIDSYTKDEKSYSLSVESGTEQDQVIILKETDHEILRFSMQDIYDNYGTDNEKTELDTAEVTFTQENDKAGITVIAESISINVWEEGKDQQADIYILVKIK